MGRRLVREVHAVKRQLLAGNQLLALHRGHEALHLSGDVHFVHGRSVVGRVGNQSAEQTTAERARPQRRRGSRGWQGGRGERCGIESASCAVLAFQDDADAARAQDHAAAPTVERNRRQLNLRVK